jgi:hypothetical protein
VCAIGVSEEQTEVKLLKPCGYYIQGELAVTDITEGDCLLRLCDANAVDQHGPVVSGYGALDAF